jgi:hypothetical protein
MFSIEAFDVLKTKEFTMVIDCLQNRNNLPAGENSGYYGQHF